VAGLRAAFLQHSASATLAAAEDGAPQDASSASAPAAALPAEPSLTAPAAQAAAGREAAAGVAKDGAPVTLESFRRLLVMLAKQKNEMEALAAHCDVGSVRVDAGRLKAALLPWPELRAEELRRMLPRLAGGERRLGLCSNVCLQPASALPVRCQARWYTQTSQNIPRFSALHQLLLTCT
jgi:hypothetical protein